MGPSKITGPSKMKSHAIRSRSIEELLEIERICDSFEDALIRDNGADIEEYARRADAAIRPAVREELWAINASRLVGNQFASAQPDALTQTAYPNDDTVTITPQQIPDSVGRFRLLNQIGEGGTGVVWRAEDEQLHRYVAVKLPHPGRVSDPDRFIHEARIAAKLQHPNIVRVLEVGRQNQQCYLVSDLIEGESLADLLQIRTLPLREAVEMLTEIADALEYSHQHGVVHRDLKPHNILLDAKGCPYVTDFGLAKNCGVDEPSLTPIGHVIGTPAYMAPEQARGRSDEADPRTDVYAMGVVLFKFLTGDVPFRGSVESVVYQVIYADPPEPSLWNRNVPRDLETICLKCLEKEPARRYTSAADLKDELQRYLFGEPILARPISTWGRVGKWFKRNRTMAILATAIASLLIAVTVGSTGAAFMLDAAWQRERLLRAEAETSAAETRQARDLEAAANATARLALKKSQHEAARAKREAEVSRQALAFMRSIFESSDPLAWVFDGQTSIVSTPHTPRQLLRNATTRIRSEFDGQPLVQARLMDTLGNSCRAVGLFDEARQLLDDAASIRSANQNAYEAVQYDIEVAENTFYRGWLVHDRGEMKEAETLYTKTLSLLDHIPQQQDLLRANVHFQTGRLLLEERRNSEAIVHFKASERLRRIHLPDDSSLVVAARIGLQLSRVPMTEELSIGHIASILSGDDWGTQLALEYTQVIFHRQRNNYPAALTAYRAVRQRLERRLGSDHPIGILALGDYAGLLWDSGNFREAYPAIETAIEKGRRLAPNHPQLKRAIKRLAKESLRNGRVEVAHKYFTELSSKLNPNEFDFDIEHGLMWTTFARKEYGASLQYSERVLAHSVGYTPPPHLAWIYYSHARVLQANGKVEDAADFDAQAIGIVKSKPMDSDSSICLERVAIILAHNKDLDAAEQVMRNALEIDKKKHPADHPRVADRLSGLANILRKLERGDEAKKLQERADAIREKQLPVFLPSD
ncbi:MAG: tetratricopeptide (TPR) repeat protein [Pirellulaceae bacterium]|jgi:tetratricopeptide (TPR) repeat protein